MATKKIIYFTVGTTPTVGEQEEIDAIKLMAEKPYNLIVNNIQADTLYGQRPQPTDYVAGSPPDAYDDVDEFDPENPPNPPLVASKAVVSDGQVFSVGGTATVTAHVTNNVVTFTYAAS